MSSSDSDNGVPSQPGSTQPKSLMKSIQNVLDASDDSSDDNLDAYKSLTHKSLQRLTPKKSVLVDSNESSSDDDLTAFKSYGQKSLIARAASPARLPPKPVPVKQPVPPPPLLPTSSVPVATTKIVAQIPIVDDESSSDDDSIEEIEFKHRSKSIKSEYDNVPADTNPKKGSPEFKIPSEYGSDEDIPMPLESINKSIVIETISGSNSSVTEDSYNSESDDHENPLLEQIEQSLLKKQMTKESDGHLENKTPFPDNFFPVDDNEIDQPVNLGDNYSSQIGNKPVMPESDSEVPYTFPLHVRKGDVQIHQSPESTVEPIQKSFSQKLEILKVGQTIVIYGEVYRKIFGPVWL